MSSHLSSPSQLDPFEREHSLAMVLHMNTTDTRGLLVSLDTENGSFHEKGV